MFRVATITIAAILLLAAPAHARFFEIEPPAGVGFGESEYDELEVIAVNRQSQVVIYTNLFDREDLSHVWQAGAYTPLPSVDPERPYGHATDINDSGQVTGSASTGKRPGAFSPRRAAVIWNASGGPPQDLGDLAPTAESPESGGVSINLAGTVGGGVAQDSPSCYSDWCRFAAMWPGGGSPQIVPDSAYNEVVYGVTTSGTRFVTGTGGPRLVHPDGAVEPIDCMLVSAEHGMGEPGFVVGSMGVNGKQVAAVFRNGTCQALPLPPGVDTARAIATNDVGAIVGEGNLGPMLWPGDGSVELLDQTRNPGDGWKLTDVVDIGNDGEIVGYGRKGAETESKRVWLIDGANNALDVNLRTGVIGNNDIFTLTYTMRNTAPAGSPAIKDLEVLAPNGIQRDDGAFGAPVIGLADVFGPAPGFPGELAAGAVSDHTYAFAVEQPGTTQIQTRLAGTDTGGSKHSDTAAVRVEAGYRVPGVGEFDPMVASGILAIFDAMQAKRDEVAAQLAKSVRDKLKRSKVDKRLLKASLYDLSVARSNNLPEDAMSWLPKKGRIAAGVAFLEGVETGLEQVGKKAFDKYAKVPFEFWRDMAFEPSPGYRASVAAQVAAIAREDTRTAGGYLGHAKTFYTTPALRADAWNQVPKIAAEAQTAIKQAEINYSKKILEWDDLMKKDPVKGSRQFGKLLGTIEGEVLVNTLEDLGGGKIRQTLGAIHDSHKAAAVKNTISDVSTASRLSGAGAKPQPPSFGNYTSDQVARMQQIAKTVGDKVGAKIEIQARPINEYANKVKGGIGKIEAVPTKNLTPDDVLLGAPAEFIGQTAYYRPKLPKHFGRMPRGEQERLKLRLNEKEKEYLQFLDPSKDPTGKAEKVNKALKPGGGEFTLGKNGKAVMELEKTVHKSGAILIRYKKLEINGKAVFTGKPRPIVSDVDLNAVIDATTGRHLPAGIRGQAELLVMREFAKAAEEGVFPFGFHGWTHSGFDIAAADFRHILKYQLMYMKPDEALALAKKFAPLYGVTPETFLEGFNTGKFLVRITESTATFGTGS